MSGKKWLITFTALFLALLLTVFALVVTVDPFFHFHAPLPGLSYTLDNQRSQNDGILKNYDYDGIITGTSMAENFKAGEAGEIYGGSFIKVPFEGGHFREIDERVRAGLEHNSAVKYVIRGLDLNFLDVEKDSERSDLGEFPRYLYDSSLVNDLEYICNKTIILRCLSVIWRGISGVPGEEYDFDNYSRWADDHELGAAAVLSEAEICGKAENEVLLSSADEQRIRENIRQNVTALPARYPDTEFYYFFTPYSAARWGEWNSGGRLEYMLETERIAIDEILSAGCENLRFYSWDDRADICLELDNYKDPSHYGEHINSLILHMMKDGEGLITRENFPAYMERLENQYRNFDFSTLYEQLN